MVTLISLTIILFFILNSVFMFQFCSNIKYKFIVFTSIYLLTQFIIIPYFIDLIKKLLGIKISVNLWEVIIVLVQIFSFFITSIIAFEERKNKKKQVNSEDVS